MLIRVAKTAAGWWSSFVYVLFVDSFHDVSEIPRLLPGQELQIAAGGGVGPVARVQAEGVEGRGLVVGARLVARLQAAELPRLSLRCLA